MICNYCPTTSIKASICWFVIHFLQQVFLYVTPVCCYVTLSVRPTNRCQYSHLGNIPPAGMIWPITSNNTRSTWFIYFTTTRGIIISLFICSATKRNRPFRAMAVGHQARTDGSVILPVRAVITQLGSVRSCVTSFFILQLVILTQPFSFYFTVQGM